jgi:hypothetical protein
MNKRKATVLKAITTALKGLNEGPDQQELLLCLQILSGKSQTEITPEMLVVWAREAKTEHESEKRLALWKIMTDDYQGAVGCMIGSGIKGPPPNLEELANFGTKTELPKWLDLWVSKPESKG